MNAIETSRLSKRYRRVWALAEVDLAVPVGGITALVGPNGAGKSTLLKLCIGFERPTGGGLRVLDADPVRDRGAAIRQLGYVPQAPSLYRDLSALDHLRMAASFRPGFDLAHARSRLASLQIPERATPSELSGGQQAQISLAIANHCSYRMRSSTVGAATLSRPRRAYFAVPHAIPAVATAE